MLSSRLKSHPRSKILEHGYINIYSNLNSKEKKQIFYNRLYKSLHPKWDNTMILASKKFETALEGLKKQNYGKLQNLKIFDAGCGNGNYVIDEFRTKIDFACGVDLKKDFTSKNICLDEIKHSSLEQIPYGDSEFNIALSLWVLEHLENPSKVIQEIYRVLKPGGLFIFTTPNKNSLLLRLKTLLGSQIINFRINKELYGREERDVFKTYYRANTSKQITSFLTEIGFINVDLTFNYDPGYTSFDDVSFKISNLLNFVLEKLHSNIFKSHIIGVAQKPR